MIHVLIDKDNTIIGAVDTKHIIGFVHDGTSPDYDPRYILKLTWGHKLTVSALDMQHILSAMENEVDNAGRQPEIIRCKDCKHLDIQGTYGECGKGILGIVNRDDFCSRAERRKR